MNPPKWSINFLKWFCPDELIEGILGDLLEQFDANLASLGPAKAKRLFIWNVIRLLHPSIILRNHLTVHLIHFGMLKSHLLVALRSMLKHKFYSIINLLGISCAITFVFLSFLFIKKELSYDQFHSKKDRIFRLYYNMVNTDNGQIEVQSAVTAIPLSKDLANELPSISNFSRYASNSCTVRKEEQTYSETLHFVDPGFLEMFDFPIIEGEKTSALDQPTSIVINEEMAKKLFGQSNPLGQAIEVNLNDSTLLFNVSAVVDAKKNQSSLPFDFLVNIENFKLTVSSRAFSSYRFSAIENYVLLNESSSQASVEPLLTEAISKFAPARKGKVQEYGLQPLKGLHLEDKIIGNALYTSPQKLYILLTIGLLVMIVAIINFITLSTSHVFNRLREVGVRKTLGALKGQLKRQFIFESFMLTLIAGILGLSFTFLLTPTFSELIGNPLEFRPGWSGVIFMLIITLFIALLNGWLQSSALIKFKPMDALKGNLLVPARNRLLNNGLIVLQLGLSIILIIGAVSIRAQMKYIQQKDLGFNEERLLEITLNGPSDPILNQQLIDRFRTRASQSQAVLSVSASMNNSREPWTDLSFEQEDGSQLDLVFNQIDPNYLKTMDIQLVEGSNYKEDMPNARQSILVNETLVKLFGWDDPFSQQIPGKKFANGHQIIGVVKDFHFTSLHQKIKPLILAVDVDAIDSGVTGLSTYVWPAGLYQLIVRIGPGDLDAALKHLEEVWKEVNPAQPFTYFFVDEALEARYAEEKRWGRAIDWASIFAILIAWLGLIGMMRLSIQKRTKEVGIRKVLGASTSGVIRLLSRRFIWLVIFGNLLAWPIAWLIMGKWLESFTYRISLNPVLFIIVGMGVLMIAICSISLQTLRLASSNPVKALRLN